MKIQNDFLGEVEYTKDDIVVFSDGILGFSDEKEYIYINNSDPIFPFGWLQSIDNKDVSFVVTNPFLFVSDYDFELSDTIIQKLDINNIEDITILSMVVIPEDPQETTINLKSPVVINNITHQAKQVILDEEYTMKHKIFKKEGAE